MMNAILWNSSAPLDLWLAGGICLCVIAFLILNLRQKGVLAERLGFGYGHLSVVNESPKSSQPSKTSGVSTASAINHGSVFPPSQRPALRNLARAMPSQLQEPVGNVEVSQDQIEQGLLGWEEDYRTAPPSKYTCSGISVQEITGLGDFPDYAALTGVPLPSPYTAFDIDKGRPRPYRPLRWVYHQNMCEQKRQSKFNTLTLGSPHETGHRLVD